jgi:D-alanyl-lipoteichoic acid acyltransferase DltB (MBOAT superfamily)
MAHVSNPFAMSCVLSTVGLAALIINSLIVIHWGRRRVILTSGLITCGVLQLIIAVVYNQKPGTAQTGKVIVGITSLYMFTYNVSFSENQQQGVAFTNENPKYRAPLHHTPG